MIISSLFLQIIRLTFNIYISNKITPEALGLFSLIMVTYIFGITLASSGINITCMRIVSEEYALKNDIEVVKSSKRCIIVSLIFSVITSLIFYNNSNFIVRYCFENKVSPNIVHLICIALPLIAISSAITGYFTAVRRIYKTVIGQFLEQISKIIATIVLFKIYKTDSSLQTICFILILGDVISEIISFIYLIIVFKFDLKHHFCNFQTKKTGTFLIRIFRILLPISFTSCIKSGISSFKQILIPSSLQKNGKNLEEALSEYGIISGMAMPIIMFPATFLIAVSGLLIPEFSRYYIKKDYSKIRLYTDKLIFYTFLFSTFITIFFLIFGNTLSYIIYHKKIVRFIHKNIFFTYSFYVCRYFNR